MRCGAAALATFFAQVAPAEAPPLVVRLGTPVPMATVAPLSSRTHAKGDLVELRTAGDVVIDGAVAIPRDTAAVGQVAESRDTGGMGTTGHLAIRPLYLRVGDRTVRLTGTASRSGSTSADTVIGMVLLTPLLSGRSAVIPAGTAVAAMVEKTVTLPVSAASRP